MEKDDRDRETESEERGKKKKKSTYPPPLLDRQNARCETIQLNTILSTECILYVLTLSVFKLDARTGGFGCLQNRYSERAAR